MTVDIESDNIRVHEPLHPTHNALRPAGGARVRRVKKNNREYLVFPIVASKEMVMNYPEDGVKEYLPAERLQESTPFWAGTNLTFVHPQNEGKTVQTANAYTTQVIGEVHDPEIIEGNKLRVNAWLDIEKAQNIGGIAQEVVNRLENGKQVATSTGYSTVDDDFTGGSYQGEQYDVEQGHIIPDHVAIFPPGTFNARCSPSDGCAAPRANAARAVSNAGKQARTPEYDGTTEAEWDPPSFTEYAEEYYSRTDADVPDDISVDSVTSEALGWIVQRTLVGNPEGESSGDVVSYPVVNLDDELNRNALESAKQLAHHSEAEESIKNRVDELLAEEFGEEKENAAVAERVIRPGDVVRRQDGESVEHGVVVERVAAGERYSGRGSGETPVLGPAVVYEVFEFSDGSWSRSDRVAAVPEPVVTRLASLPAGGPVAGGGEGSNRAATDSTAGDDDSMSQSNQAETLGQLFLSALNLGAGGTANAEDGTSGAGSSEGETESLCETGRALLNATDLTEEQLRGMEPEELAPFVEEGDSEQVVVVNAAAAEQALTGDQPEGGATDADDSDAVDSDSDSNSDEDASTQSDTDTDMSNDDIPSVDDLASRTNFSEEALEDFEDDELRTINAAAEASDLDTEPDSDEDDTDTDTEDEQSDEPTGDGGTDAGSDIDLPDEVVTQDDLADLEDTVDSIAETVNEKENAAKKEKARAVANAVEVLTVEDAMNLDDDRLESLAEEHAAGSRVNYGAVPGSVDRTPDESSDHDDWPAGGRSDWEQRQESD